MSTYFRECNLNDIEGLMHLQDRCFENITNSDWLRKNTKELLLVTLQRPSYAIGMFDDDNLVAIAILHVCKQDKENLGYSLGINNLDEVGNMKLVLVDPDYRGQGLQYKLMSDCEKYARESGLKILATTVHPDNVYSANNIKKSGYVFHSRHQKYGGLVRDLYYKEI